MELTCILSFAEPDSTGKKGLGRILVHDRIAVETEILPKYFNHSSFASLRRQLNYFRFVRVGKGRQRESIYVNDQVIVLNDILKLKRRSQSSLKKKERSLSNVSSNAIVSLSGDDEDEDSEATAPVSPLVKRRRLSKRSLSVSPNVSLRNVVTAGIVAVENLIVSEDEEQQSSGNNSFKPPTAVSLDLTTDKEVMAGCSALLTLCQKRWI